MASRCFCCLGEVNLITSVYFTISNPQFLVINQFGILKILVLTKILTGVKTFPHPQQRFSTLVYYTLNKLRCVFGAPGQCISKTRMLEEYCIIRKGCCLLKTEIGPAVYFLIDFMKFIWFVGP